MRNIFTIFTLLGLTITSLSLAACYNRPTNLPPGEYERTSRSVDQYGTARENESKTKVYYDEYGNKKATVEKKKTTDPKGLFNKSTSESKTTID